MKTETIYPNLKDTAKAVQKFIAVNTYINRENVL